MAQLQTKNLADLIISTVKLAANAVTEAKLRLTNNAYLRARNAADSADVNVFKVNASDRIEFASMPQSSAVPSTGNDLVNKTYADSLSPAALIWENGPYTMLAGDITAQYVDLSYVVADLKSFTATFNGLVLTNTVDYTLTNTGSGGVGRFNFLGDIATGGNSALVAGDVVCFKYQR